jgi:hypothetical protein
VPAMRGGEIVLTETIERMQERTDRSLGSLPAALRRGDGAPYPVTYSAVLDPAAGA